MDLRQDSEHSSSTKQQDRAILILWCNDLTLGQLSIVYQTLYSQSKGRKRISGIARYRTTRMNKTCLCEERKGIMATVGLGMAIFRWNQPGGAQKDEAVNDA